jgi:HD-GYP domain-containing protein (c-di-GMP phosphodiesterase class II)
VRIGRARGLAEGQIEPLRLAALMHDIGKIGVPDDILLKPHELSPRERAMVERHPVVGAEILQAITGTGQIAEIVLCHHECPDGSGYPRGLRGDQIPPAAAILRVADVFSALTEHRAYKATFSVEEALAHITSLAGKTLDADVVQTLRRIATSPRD